MEDNTTRQEVKKELLFEPVRGTENAIKRRKAKDNCVYFALDTKRIFCGKNEEYIPMGGNSGIYYGNRTITEEEEILEKSTFDFFVETDIDGDQIPNIDDLILNIPDGCFYRVKSISENTVMAERLTISGSGGGGSAGGGLSLPIIHNLSTETK